MIFDPQFAELMIAGQVLKELKETSFVEVDRGHDETRQLPPIQFSVPVPVVHHRIEFTLHMVEVYKTKRGRGQRRNRRPPSWLSTPERFERMLRGAL